MSSPSPIVCLCSHPVHFEGGRSVQDRLDIDPTHPYGNPCTHVVRAWDDSGLLVCAACDKVGHASRPAAGPEVEFEVEDLWSRITDPAIRRNQDAEVFEKDEEA